MQFKIINTIKTTYGKMLVTCFSQIAERDYFYENLIWRIKSVKQQPN